MKNAAKNVQNFTSNEINIQTCSICNLKCIFCARYNVSELQLKTIESHESMSLNLFIKIIEKCTMSNIDVICLTPRMGELLLDSTLIEKLEYLEQNKKIKKYFFSTNLTICGEKLLNFITTSNKCLIQISYYGNLPKFKYLTNGKDEDFFIFIKNLKYIVKYNKDLINKISISQRFKDGDLIPSIKILKTLGMKYVIDYVNYNFGAFQNIINPPNNVIKNGKCPTKQTGNISVDGYYNLCYPNDIFESSNQVHVLRSPLSIIELRKKYSNISLDLCKRCNESWG